ncbi:MAG: 50S ribosomal protein L1 [Solobacterium sp.]|jgi:large subunit ribosomal protein L1|nr:50S ribosomal protein L1 [Solobacterium sp.]MBR3344659.1 50S ribosomal protein L1 [Solobacterium sp.]
MAGKKFKAAQAQVDSTKLYPYAEGVALAKKLSTVKFDATVEASFFLNVDPRQAEQNLRGAMVLPNGTGKTRKVLVITQGPKEQEAKDAGADFVGGADMIEKIKGGWFDFDIIVATPDMMGQLGKLGRLLGPKGLMPNPKTGTVTTNIAQAIEEIKKGKITYRVDRDGNINCLIGKCSFSDEALAENFKALYDQLNRIKPATVKGTYMKGITVSTTMGPGVKVTVE